MHVSVRNVHLYVLELILLKYIDVMCIALSCVCLPPTEMHLIFPCKYSSIHAISNAIRTSPSHKVSVCTTKFALCSAICQFFVDDKLLCFYSHIAQLHQVAQSAGHPKPEITTENTPQVSSEYVCVVC